MDVVRTAHHPRHRWARQEFIDQLTDENFSQPGGGDSGSAFALVDDQARHHEVVVVVDVGLEANVPRHVGVVIDHYAPGEPQPEQEVVVARFVVPKVRWIREHRVGDHFAGTPR